MLNDKVDKLAQVGRENQHSPILGIPNIPYAHSDITLWINKTMITSNLIQEIKNSISKNSSEWYVSRKFSWNTSQIQCIALNEWEKALFSRTPYEAVQINKITFNWAPLNARKHLLQQSESPHCCKCNTIEESLSHFFKCPHWNVNIEWLKLWSTLKKLKIHPLLISFLFEQWRSNFSSTPVILRIQTPPIITYEALIVDVIQKFKIKQRSLGPCAALKGYFHVHILKCLQQNNQPCQEKSNLVMLIKISHSITLKKWNCRNSITHSYETKKKTQR